MDYETYKKYRRKGYTHEQINRMESKSSSRKDEDDESSGSNVNNGSSAIDYDAYKSMRAQGFSHDEINALSSSAKNFTKEDANYFSLTKSVSSLKKQTEAYFKDQSKYHSQNTMKWYQAKVDDLLKQVNTAREHYANSSDYDEDYAKDVMNNLVSGETYLKELQKSFTNMSDYYSQFETEDDYNQYLAGVKEQKRLSKIDLSKAKAEMDDLQTQLNQIAPESTIQNIPWAATEDQREQYAELKKMLGEKETEYESANKVQSGIKYNSYLDAPDFKEYAEKGADAPENKIRSGEESNTRLGAAFRASLPLQDPDNVVADTLFMEDTEKELYNYMLGKYGADEADKYLDHITDTLKQREGAAMAEGVKDQPVVRELFGLQAGAVQFGKGIARVFSDDALQSSATEYAGQQVRENLPEGSFSQGVYDVSQIIGNVAPSIIVGTASGGVIGVGTMALSAGGNYYKEMIDAGYSKEQAQNYAILAGASEGAMQYVLGGIGKLGGKVSGKAVSGLLKNVNNSLLRISGELVGKGISEGTEEYLQDILNPVFRNMTLGENNEFKIWTPEAAHSFLLGAITAGLLDGPSTVRSTLSTQQSGRAILQAEKYDALVQGALALDPGTEAHKLAQKMVDGKTNASAVNVGKLVGQYQAEGGDLSFMYTPNETYSTDQAEIELKDTEEVLTQAASEAAMVQQNEGQSVLMQENASQPTQVGRLSYETTTQEVDDYDNLHIKAYDGDVPVGEMMVILYNDGAYLERIDVDKDKQNLGYGTQMIKYATSLFDNVYTAPDNEDARRLYERIGSEMTDEDYNEFGYAIDQGYGVYEFYNMPQEAVERAVTDEGVQATDRTAAAENARIGQVSPATEAETEGRSGVVAAVDTNTRKTVEITGIVDKKNGKLYVQKSDGGRVALENVAIQDESYREIYKAASNFDTETAKLFVEHYHGGINASEYFIGFTTIYGAGRKGMSLLEARGVNEYAERLPDVAAGVAIYAGRKSVTAETAQQKTEAPEKPKQGGVVRVFKGKISKSQDAQLNAIDTVFKAVGRTVVVEDKISEVKGRQIESAPNAYFDPETNEYHIALDSTGQAYMYFAAHESVHDIAVNNPLGYDVLEETVFDILRAKGDDVDARIAAQRELHPEKDEAYWKQEVIANTVPVILTDEQFGKEFAERFAAEDEETRSVFQKILDSIRVFLQKAYNILKKEKSWQQMELIEGDIKAIDAIRNVYLSALEEAAGLEAVGNQEPKFSIRELEDGKKFVEWDRKVIKGRDPKKWGQQVEDYINSEIRKGKDVVVLGENNTPLTISAYTAGKASARNLRQFKDGRTREYTDKEYALKLRAETHIDELAKVSTGKGHVTKPDFKEMHAFATSGFTYRTAYFKDPTGYYEMQFSVGRAGKVNTVYNIGIIKRTAPPTDGLKGPGRSKTETGSAVPSDQNVPQADTTVKDKKPRFSLKDPVDPMYSKLQRMLDEYKGDKIAVSGLIPYLSGKGVKAEEIKWSGIEQFVEGKKSVTKSELAEFLAGNSLVINDKLSGGEKEYQEYMDWARNEAVELFDDREDGRISVRSNEDRFDYYEDEDGTWVLYDDYGNEIKRYDNYEDALQAAEEFTDNQREYWMEEYSGIPPRGEDKTKYSEHKLHGGENYREALFMLPHREPSYKSPHWDEKNVVAHARLQDFKAADGAPVLFVEEVQSDWHQEGLKKGYKKPLNDAEYERIRNAAHKALENNDNLGFDNRVQALQAIRQHPDWDSRWDIADSEDRAALQEYRDHVDTSTVPDAPFRDTWQQYVMKRVLRMAAEGDYKYVAWTTGQIQADRYNLAKYVDRISAGKSGSGGYVVTVYDKSNNTIYDNGNVNPAQLAEVIGKEAAQKVVEQVESSVALITTIPGEGLSVGGEGMKAFYDIGGKSSQNIPRFMNKYVKQWESKVQEVDIDLGDGNAYSVPGVKVTDAMKKDVLYRGQPRFSLKDTSSVDTQQLEQENERLTEALELVKAQLKLTEGHRVSDKALEKLAKNILKEYSSEYSVDALTVNLRTMFDYLGNAEQPAWDEVAQMGVGMGKAILQKSKELDRGAYEYFSEARKYLQTSRIRLTEKQYNEVVFAFGSYDNYRKVLFGNVNFTNDGVPLEVVWQELSDMYPELFSPDTNDGDMPAVLKNVIEMSRPYYVNPYGYDMDDAAYDLFLQVYDKYFDIPEVRTYADKKTAELARVKAQYRSKIAEIRAESKEKYADRLKVLRAENVAKRQELSRRYNEAKAKKDAETTKRLKDQYKKLTDKKNEALMKQKAAFREWKATDRAKRAEHSAKTKYRSRIEKNLKDLYAWMMRPTDAKHVPEPMRKMVASFLGTIDMAGSKNTLKAKKWRDKLRDLKDSMARIERGQANVDYSGFYAELDPDFIPRLEEFIDLNRDVSTVEDMDAGQLRELDFLVGILKKSVVEANRLHSNARFEDVAKLGIATIDDLGKQKAASRDPFVKTVKRALVFAEMDSFSFFDELGNSAKSVLTSMRNGFDKKIVHINEAMERMKVVLKDADTRKWSGKGAQAKTFKVQGGELTLTNAQVMELYLLNQRDQARGHIYGGGVKVPDVRAKVGKRAASLITHRPVKVTPADIESITGTLTKKQKAIADDMQKFISENASEWGNEASMTLYGYRKFTEENYWPIKTDEDYVNTQDPDTVNQLYALRNLGMTKSTVKGARNPLVLGDVFDTFTRHIDEMATYNGLVVPLSDAMKWFNFREVEAGSVKQSIGRALNDDGKRYFVNLIKDINGVTNTDFTTGLQEKAVRNAKIAAVAANLRVVIQQPTSYLRSMNVIKGRHLLSAVFHKSNIAKALKYAPIAKWKAWGFYDLNISRSMREIIIGDSTMMQKARQAGLWLAQQADNFTWGYLWNAAVADVKATRNDLTPGSEEFNRAVGERLSEIIDRTQVVDTVFHRSQIMRSRSLLSQMTSAFMAEPIKSYNMLRNAFSTEGTTAEKAKAIGRAAVTFAATAVFNAAAAAVIDAFRRAGADDDKDEKEDTWVQRWIGALGQNIADNVNPLNMIPYAKDVWSLVEGFNPSRLDLKGAETFLNVAKQWIRYFSGDSKWSTYRLTYQTASALSTITGVPVGNLMRTFQGIYNAVAEENIDMESETATAGKSYETLYKAILAGDSAKESEIRKLLLNDKDSPRSSADIDTGIAKVLMERDLRIAEAYVARAAADTVELRSIMSDIENDGFGVEVVTKAINLYENTMKKKSGEVKNKELNEPLYDYDDLFEAIRNGDITDIQDIYEELLSDSKAEDPVAAIKSAVSGEIKKDYISYVDSGNEYGAYDLAETLQFFGYDDEDLQRWVMNDKSAKMREAIASGDSAAANEYIRDQQELGRDESGIKSSLTNTYKAKVLQLYEEGDTEGIQEIINTLSNLDLRARNGSPYYTYNYVWSWVHAYYHIPGVGAIE